MVKQKKNIRIGIISLLILFGITVSLLTFGRKQMNAQNEVLKTYGAFLTYYMQEWEKAGKGEKEIPRFKLIYLDNDAIPELVIMEGMTHSSGAGIYTYRAGEAVFIGKYGQYGAMSYQEKEGIVFDDYDQGGNLYSSVYQIVDTEETLLQSFSERWEFVEGTEEIRYTYTVDGKEASEEEYEKVFLKWNNGLIKMIEYDMCVPVADADILEKLAEELENLILTQKETENGISDSERHPFCSLPMRISDQLETKMSIPILEEALSHIACEEFGVEDAERIICHYESIWYSPFKADQISVYKETVEKDIVFEGVLLLETNTGKIYVMEDEEWVPQKIGVQKALSLSGEPEDVLRYDGSSEPENNEIIDKVLDHVIILLKKEKGYENFKLIYEGTYLFLDRGYYCVSLVEETEFHITRVQEYYIDLQSTDLYERSNDIDTGSRMELYYIGNLEQEPEEAEAGTG